MIKSLLLNRNYVVISELSLLFGGAIIVGYFLLAAILLLIFSLLLILKPNFFKPINRNVIIEYMVYSLVIGLFIFCVYKFLDGNLLLIIFIGFPLVIYKEIKFYKSAWDTHTTHQDEKKTSIKGD